MHLSTEWTVNTNKRRLFRFTIGKLCSLFTIYDERENQRDFGIFYDSGKNSNVDFLINTIKGDIIPIEMGIGNKNKRQIKNAMNKYNSNFGIVVSNKTKSIVKDDDVLFI